MSNPVDDLEAVRQIAALLQPFDPKDRERIIRWSREKLGMHLELNVTEALVKADKTKQEIGISVAKTDDTAIVEKSTQGSEKRDIKSFITEKNPRSDIQLAAVVAYYHRFVAPENEQKDQITAEDITEACRKADRDRIPRPAQTLVNAFNAGVIDKGESRGGYRINTVGENLVAMVLPNVEERGKTLKRAVKKKSQKPKAKKRTGK